jgi:hypothetical protein
MRQRGPLATGFSGSPITGVDALRLRHDPATIAQIDPDQGMGQALPTHWAHDYSCHHP